MVSSVTQSEVLLSPVVRGASPPNIPRCSPGTEVIERKVNFQIPTALSSGAKSQEFLLKRGRQRAKSRGQSRLPRLPRDSDAMAMQLGLHRLASFRSRSVARSGFPSSRKACTTINSWTGILSFFDSPLVRHPLHHGRVKHVRSNSHKRADEPFPINGDGVRPSPQVLLAPLATDLSRLGLNPVPEILQLLHVFLDADVRRPRLRPTSPPPSTRLLVVLGSDKQSPC